MIKTPHFTAEYVIVGKGRKTVSLSCGDIVDLPRDKALLKARQYAEETLPGRHSGETVEVKKVRLVA